MPALPDLIACVQQADSAEALLRATLALAAVGDPAAADTLVEVLSFNNPGAAVAAVDGLIAIGPTAVPSLLELDASNYGARAWAVRALAGIGAVEGLTVLEEALATDVGPSVRRAAARGLGQLRLETLADDARQVTMLRCLEALEAGAADGEWVVRYAVIVGLERLALPEPAELRAERRAVVTRIRQRLNALASDASEDTPVVRLRAGQALERLESDG
ncbi:MAG: HEAT repeat domain-containing protein [Cyanobacteriota bacterium]